MAAWFSTRAPRPAPVGSLRASYSNQFAQRACAARRKQTTPRRTRRRRGLRRRPAAANARSNADVTRMQPLSFGVAQEAPAQAPVFLATELRLPRSRARGRNKQGDEQLAFRT